MKKAFALLKKTAVVIGGIIIGLILNILLIGVVITSSLWYFFKDSFNESKSPYIYRGWDEAIDNVFDEMLANECKGLREADYILQDSEERSGTNIFLRFKKPLLGMEAFIACDTYYDDGSLGSRLPINLSFYDQNEDANPGQEFSYYSSLNTLVSYDLAIEYEEGINWKYIEKSEEQYYSILNEFILEQWLETEKSQFDRGDLGNFKIIRSIPYAYTGLVGSEPYFEKIIEEGEVKVIYYVWLDNDKMLCVQRGNCFQTRKKDSGEICSLKDLLSLNDDFYHWIKTSGQANGNLERIPESMEKGMQNTQLMLQNCPVEEIEKMLPTCEFYLEPGHLHIYFPYWNWESENPAWERNGDELWRGWLNLKTEDIEGFLKVEKW